MQNLVQMVKTVISDPENTGKSLEPMFVNFIKGSSDHFFLVYVKVLLKFERNFVQNGH